MAADSLKRRYFFKLSTNTVGLFISFFTQMIVPRGLGPGAYGDFNFLVNFFTRLVNFFDAGTSTCFYTKISQRQKEPKLVSLYFYFMAIVSLLVGLSVICIGSGSIAGKLWPGQNIFYIYLAVVLVILTWIVEIMIKMNDAYGLTVPAEIAKIFQKIIGLILIFCLFMYNGLNLRNFFFYNYFILFFLIAAFIWIIKKNGYFDFSLHKLKFGEIKSYVREFYRYTHPLFIYNLVGMVAAIFDRWLLQVYGGSIQQGFFGLSFQIGAVCFLFSSAMTPIITREFSIAHNNQDLRFMAGLFRRHIPLLYSVTAFLACFIAANADKVTLVMGGGKFKEASLAVGIMAFYPIHQTYGQLSGAIFYATEQTRLYRNIGVVFMLIGLPLTYILIAPHKAFGLDLGANGLALKMVLIQVIAVNAQLYFNAKLLKLSFYKYIGHQILSAGCLLVIAGLSSLLIKNLLNMGNVILALFLSGVLYALISAIAVYYFPVLFGITKEDVRLAINKLRGIFGVNKR